MRDSRFFYTGVRATEEQEHAMRGPFPIMVIGGSVTPSQGEVMHEIATTHHDLPDIKGHYGYDFAEHEFIRWPDAFEEAPDAFPSRKLGDIIR